MFCDLFAAYAIGPAYGWAHIHLCMRRPTDSFLCPALTETSHPANAARMVAIIEALRAAGFAKEADELSDALEKLMIVTGEKPEADYNDCYPPELLRVAVDFSFEGYKKAGCVVMSRAGMGVAQALLNEAWRKFRADPTNYSTWEHLAMDHFFKGLGL